MLLCLIQAVSVDETLTAGRPDVSYEVHKQLGDRSTNSGYLNRDIYLVEVLS